MRESWTDERLDDLSKRVDDGFLRMDAEFREVRTAIGGLHGEMGGIRGEIAGLQRTLIIGFFGVFASLLGAVAAAIVGHAL